VYQRRGIRVIHSTEVELILYGVFYLYDLMFHACHTLQSCASSKSKLGFINLVLSWCSPMESWRSENFKYKYVNFSILVLENYVCPCSVMTSTYAIRHPWFSMPSNKRKLPPSPTSSSDNDEHEGVKGRSSQTGSAKRRRCSTLERDLAHLAINHPIPQTNSYYASPFPSPTSSNPSVLNLNLPVARTPSPALMDLEDTIIHPTSIEEPTSPDFSSLPLSENEPNDIQMKSQSWYEPEKDRKALCLLLMPDFATDSIT
jgi:hypothetical protein